jgi:hypothetical protein
MRAPLALGCALLLALGACSGGVADPEQEIRALLTELERASRENDIRALKGRVSERYSDAEGRAKSEIDGLIAAHYLRGGTVYLLLHLRELELADESSARADVLAGMARVAIESFARLRQARGDAYVFDLALAREDGEWRVTSASWEPAALEDLLPGG